MRYAVKIETRRGTVISGNRITVGVEAADPLAAIMTEPAAGAIRRGFTSGAVLDLEVRNERDVVVAKVLAFDPQAVKGVQA